MGFTSDKFFVHPIFTCLILYKYAMYFITTYSRISDEEQAM